MKHTELAIVGNGFDMALKLPSSFGAFEAYVAAHDRDVHEAIEDYLHVNGDWRDLEEAFAWFDGPSAMDEAAEQLVGYGADDWSDSYHHAPQQAAQDIAKALTKGIRRHLAEWARTLDATRVPGLVTMPLSQEIPYLQFNYTSTLQRVFHVPDANVLHIHGQAARGDELVLGHARPPAGAKTLSTPHDHEDADVRMREAAQILDDVLDATSKRSPDVIAANASFFAGLSGVGHVIVLGHSLAEVDHPYFEEVRRHVRPDALWRVSCYSDGDRVRAEKLRQVLGIMTTQWIIYDLSTWLTWHP